MLPPVIEFVDPHLAEDQQKKIVSKYNFFGFIDKIAIFTGGAKILPGGAAPPLAPGWLRPCFNPHSFSRHHCHDLVPFFFNHRPTVKFFQHLCSVALVLLFLRGCNLNLQNFERNAVPNAFVVS